MQWKKRILFMFFVLFSISNFLLLRYVDFLYDKKFVTYSYNVVRNIFFNRLWNNYSGYFDSIIRDDSKRNTLIEQKFGVTFFELFNAYSEIKQVAIYEVDMGLLFLLNENDFDINALDISKLNLNVKKNKKDDFFDYSIVKDERLLRFISFLNVDYISGKKLCFEIVYDLDYINNTVDTFWFYYFLIIFLSFMCFIIIVNYCFDKYDTIIQKVNDEKIDIIDNNRRLFTQNSEKSIFFVNSSHELRTPLNSIISFSEMIQQIEDKTKIDEFASSIYDAGNYLLELINDLLDFSKSEVGKLDINKQWCDLSEILNDSIRMLRSKIADANINLNIVITFVDNKLKSDPKRVKQVILNILSNSLKFTNENGSIDIRGYDDDDFLYIEINDNGIGIADEDLSRVLSVYGQVDSMLSKKHKGVGVGLPLSKNLMELMDGSLYISSKLGVGTSVILKFIRESRSQ